MDANQRDHTAEDESAPGSTGEAAPSRMREARMLAKQIPLPLWAEALGSSNVRKEQVRAALFRKVDPIRIGRFILLGPIGGGAMGEIFEAYDDRLDRKVALKLVRGGTELTANADERLLREAQTLAQVSHPNVVQIYEAGTYDGRLFIAMELISGKPLSRWLEDAAQVPRAGRQREILRQFIAAGHGLEAAHAAGVAHRDFKPDNVLVGDDGRVRVVDFGLARALGDEPDGGMSARSERELELDDDGDGAARAEAPGGADRRSDQFSFCVALYHALYGAFPFSGRSLRELGDSMESGEVELVPSEPVPAFVRKALVRGLSVEPSQRFASMGELLAALESQRFASMGELLAALEPKARCLRGWIAAAMILITVVLATVVGLRSQAADPCAAAGTEIDAAWSADRQVAVHAAFLRSELPFAEAAWRGVKTLVDGYARRWRGEGTAACRATHIARTQSAQQLDRRMLCLDRGRRQLAALVGELGTGAPDAVEHAIEATGALPDLDACSHAENLRSGPVPPPAPVAAEVAAIRDRLARALTLELLGRYEESLAIARDASATAERLGYAPVHAEALTQVARAVGTRSTADARALAQRLYFEALGIAEAERHDQLTVEIWNKLVMLAVRMDSSMAQAHAWWGQAYAWSRRNAVAVHGAGDDAYEEARLHHVLGEIYYRESEYAKAVDEERRAIAAISRSRAHQLELIRYYDALAKSLEVLDGLDEAMRLHERALAIATETLGADHPNVLSLKINYGKALEKCGRLDRARSVLEDALASMPARYRDAHPDAARIHSFLSSLDYTQGHLDRAAEHGRASLAIYERTLSPDHVRLAEAYTNLANVEIKRRSFDHARALYEDALVLRRRHLGNDHYLIGVNEGSIAEALVDLERPGEALPHLREAERIFTRGSGHERETQAWILTVRGELLAGERQFGAAVPVLERALALFSDDAADPTNHALAMWTLARALHELGSDRDRVRSLAERAHAIFTALGAVEAYDRDAVARFLDRLPGRQARRHPRTGSGPKQ